MLACTFIQFKASAKSIVNFYLSSIFLKLETWRSKSNKRATSTWKHLTITQTAVKTWFTTAHVTDGNFLLPLPEQLSPLTVARWGELQPRRLPARVTPPCASSSDPVCLHHDTGAASSHTFINANAPRCIFKLAVHQSEPTSQLCARVLINTRADTVPQRLPV